MMHSITLHIHVIQFTNIKGTKEFDIVMNEVKITNETCCFYIDRRCVGVCSVHSGVRSSSESDQFNTWNLWEVCFLFWSPR